MGSAVWAMISTEVERSPLLLHLEAVEEPRGYLYQLVANFAVVVDHVDPVLLFPLSMLARPSSRTRLPCQASQKRTSLS